ncbi:MAG: chemotaxis protein CheW [Rickettsiales bacterium]|nr:chemotaxis protein CheW [Rickettsiales bacterium]
MSDVFDQSRDAARAAISVGGTTQQFLTFTVGEEEYGVDIMTVREIKGWTDTTRLPNTPDYMRGVMNLRGLIIPIFDLRARFTGELTNATPKHVTIVLAAGDRTVSILADTVSDILTVGSNEVKPAPEVETTVDQRYVTGLIAVEQRMVVILDIEKLLGKSMDHLDVSESEIHH